MALRWAVEVQVEVTLDTQTRLHMLRLTGVDQRHSGSAYSSHIDVLASVAHVVDRCGGGRRPVVECHRLVWLPRSGACFRVSICLLLGSSETSVTQLHHNLRSMIFSCWLQKV